MKKTASLFSFVETVSKVCFLVDLLDNLMYLLVCMLCHFVNINVFSSFLLNGINPFKCFKITDCHYGTCSHLLFILSNKCYVITCNVSFKTVWMFFNILLWRTLLNSCFAKLRFESKGDYYKHVLHIGRLLNYHAFAGEVYSLRKYKLYALFLQ